MNIPSAITRQCMDLTQLLGVSCIPYSIESRESLDAQVGEWQVESVFGSHAALVLRNLSSLEISNTELVIPLTSHSVGFAIPIPCHTSSAWYALGRLALSNIESSRVLIRTAKEAVRRGFELAEQNVAMEQLEQELHRSFDERVWMRNIHLDRAGKSSRGQQSRKSLESLRSLLNAEAIALYIYSDVSEEIHGLQSLLTQKSPWQIDDVQKLLHRVGRPMCGESKILRDVNVQLPGGVLSDCVIVPVGEIEAIGYLVAMNRRKGSANSVKRNFDSRDADLLFELATTLEIDGQSNLLLKEGEQLVLGTLRAMSNAIEARDPYTHGHSERVAQVGYEIAVRLDLSEVMCQEIYLSGILHDIGKIGIPDNVLLKPGKLTPEEFAVIKKHPEIGHRIIEGLGKLRFALPGVLHHHERWDGGGYPYHLQRDRIPLMARVLAVSDAFDAMTSSRVYRTAMSQVAAVDVLRDGAGKQWDPDAVDAFVQFFEEHQGRKLDNSEAEVLTRKSQDWRLVSRAVSALQL